MRISRKLVVAATVAAALAAPAAAGATDYQYFLGNPAYAGIKIEGPRHSITLNRVWQNQNTRVGAGARDVDHNQYGSYNYGNGYASHTYSGSNLLYPVAYFPDATWTGKAIGTY